MKHDTHPPYLYEHDPIPFDFRQSVERFHVEELPLFRPSGKGEWMILTIRKKDLSTYKLLSVLKSATGASDREIGYAGLKDKNATALQRISLPRRYESGLKNLKTERIEVLERTLNRQPLRIGALSGNAFRIVLERMEPKSYPRFQEALEAIRFHGFPNYFGYQRFGSDGESWKQGKEIAHSGKRLHGAKERLLVASYQSKLFNDWLTRRVEISRIIKQMEPPRAAKTLNWPEELIQELKKQPSLFKLFLGDRLQEYPRGKKERFCRDMLSDSQAFTRKSVAPTGLLPGERAPRAQLDARHLEAPYDDDEITGLRGNRRFAWVWPEKVSSDYDPERRQAVVRFTLPPGAYATTLLEEIAKRSLKPSVTPRS